MRGDAWTCVSAAPAAGLPAGLFAANALRESKDERSTRPKIFTELLHSAETAFKVKDD
jgi:hypothetical protein